MDGWPVICSKNGRGVKLVKLVSEHLSSLKRRDEQTVLGGTNRGNLILWQPIKEEVGGGGGVQLDHNFKFARLFRLVEEGINCLAEAERKSCINYILIYPSAL